MTTLNISDIVVEFQHKRILDGITATFHGGELTAIIGPNGVGKTTLIKAIARLVKVEGSVVLEDKKTQKLSRDKIAYVPQMSSANTNLTVFEMVLLGLIKNLSWKVSSEQIDAVEEVLRALNLLEISEKQFSKLSGGQRQIVTMAQALISKPKVLLLDEPTSALDLRHQLQIMDIAQKYTRETGAVTLFVIHDLTLAGRYSDNIILLQNGKIKKYGVLEDVFQPELLKQAYEVEVKVDYSDDGLTSVIPVRPI